MLSAKAERVTNIMKAVVHKLPFFRTQNSNFLDDYVWKVDVKRKGVRSPVSVLMSKFQI